MNLEVTDVQIVLIDMILDEIMKGMTTEKVGEKRERKKEIQ